MKEEGNETVTKCHALKMTAQDGKKRLTDVANTEQLLRLIQSISSFSSLHIRYGCTIYVRRSRRSNEGIAYLHHTVKRFNE